MGKLLYFPAMLGAWQACTAKAKAVRRMIWVRACKFDRCSPSEVFVVFSPTNPFVRLLDLNLALLTGKSLPHRRRAMCGIDYIDPAFIRRCGWQWARWYGGSGR